MDINKAVQIFKFLGLTEYQSRVLYALMKKKSSSISDISKLSGVPNTRVYDVVKQLMDKEYVLQISDKPKLYRVRNVDLVLDHLLEKKSQEFEAVKNDLEKLKKYFKEDGEEMPSSIVHVDKEIDFVKVLNEELRNAKKSIVGFGNTELLHKPVLKTLNNVSQKNVDVKILAHPKVHENISNYNFEMKSLNHNLSTYVIDDNKVIMKLSNDDSSVHHLGVLQNHDGYKNMIKTYFDYCWNQDN